VTVAAVAPVVVIVNDPDRSHGRYAVVGGVIVAGASTVT